MLKKILSGGQTGVDRAALDVAMAFQFSCGGSCPLGRKAEDGAIDAKYPLTELRSASYAARTRQNILDSDGTLILAFGPLTGGTLLTHQLCRRHQKAVLVAEIQQPKLLSDHDAIEDWLIDHKIEILNIAGPRESSFPTAYGKSLAYLSQLFSRKAFSTVPRKNSNTIATIF